MTFMKYTFYYSRDIPSLSVTPFFLKILSPTHFIAVINLDELLHYFFVLFNFHGKIPCPVNAIDITRKI